MEKGCQTLTYFRWTSPRDQAAIDAAADVLSDTEIAAKAGVSRQAYTGWKAHPEFQARVAEIIAEANRRLEKQAIRHKTQRVAAQHDRWVRMQQVIAERADDHEWSHVPGWSTGLLVHRQKQIGGGRDAQIVDEFEVDTGLLAEMRNTEKQAAQELGQWTEGKTTHEHTGVNGDPIRFIEVLLPAEDEAE